MRNGWALVLMITAAMLLVAGSCQKSDPAGGDDVKVVHLTYANFPPASTFPCVQMERWKEEVETRTGGKVKISTFPGGTLIGAKEMMDGVIAGQADIGCLCMAYQPGRFAITNATSLPLGIPNATVGSRVLMDLFMEYEPEAFADVKVLTLFTTAPSNLMTREPVRSLEDIEGMAIRASGGAVKILDSWGASANGMPMSSTPEALQKGVVKGLFSSVEVMKDFKFAELCKYITMTDTVIYPFAVVMNKEKWDSLSPDVQAVMEELFAEQCNWTGEYMDGHVVESVNWSKENHDVEVIELDAATLDAFNARLEPITEKWIEDANAKGLDGDGIVAFLRERIAAHEGQAGQ